jgi:hypothetical protein
MALVNLGTVTRPSGSDSYPPAVGTVVPYAYAQPIVDLDAQADKYGWRNLGILGNLEHLQKHGGHTPWRAGSKRGIVWALDRTMPAGFRQWLVAKCKSDYDTTWIRFFNIDGMQFGQDGAYLRTSADHHLHLEVEDGSELKHVTLFDDYAREVGGVALTDDDIKRIWDCKIGSSALGIPAKGVTEWLKSFEVGARDAKGARADLAAVTTQLAGMRTTIEALAAVVAAGGGDLPVAAILARIDEQAEASRAQVAALQADLDAEQEKNAELAARLAAALAA